MLAAGLYGGHLAQVRSPALIHDSTPHPHHPVHPTPSAYTRKLLIYVLVSAQKSLVSTVAANSEYLVIAIGRGVACIRQA